MVTARFIASYVNPHLCSISIHISGHVRSVIRIRCCDTSAVCLGYHTMFVIVSIGNGCSIRFCRCDHISITVITVSNRCSVISSCTGQLILLIISIRGCLSILSCLRCYIAKCIISVSFCSVLSFRKQADSLHYKSFHRLFHPDIQWMLCGTDHHNDKRSYFLRYPLL